MRNNKSLFKLYMEELLKVSDIECMYDDMFNGYGIKAEDMLFRRKIQNIVDLANKDITEVYIAIKDHETFYILTQAEAKEITEDIESHWDIYKLTSSYDMSYREYRPYKTKKVELNNI